MSGLLHRAREWLVAKKNEQTWVYLCWMNGLRLRAAINLRKFDDRQAIIHLYKRYAGREPDLDNPVRFSEKMQWLKLNYRPTVQTILADKHEVRTYLTDKGFGHLLNEQLACVSSVEDINFSVLPNQFVVKAAHASGWNLICQDKQSLDVKSTKARLASWLQQGIFWNGREWPYKNIPRRLVIEEYLEDSSGGLRDYKVFCFSGSAQFIQANSGRASAEHAQNFYSVGWELLPFGKDLTPRPDITIPRPGTLDEMVELAQKLSTGHPFVRVDFYDVDNRLIFGELTFYPASGLPDFKPDQFDFTCGDMLHLPSANEMNNA